jgi:hypothetical protein
VTVDRELGTDAQPTVTVDPRQTHLNPLEKELMTPQDTHASTELGPASTASPANYGEAIGPDDLLLPKLFVAHSSSRVVQEGLVPFGALYVATDAGDPEPALLYEPGDKEGVRLYLVGSRRVWCFQDSSERYRVVDARDSELPPSPDAQRGYDLAVLIPAFDKGLPCTWLCKSSALDTARRIFTSILRSAPDQGWGLAFGITTVQRQNSKGRWFVPQAVQVKADPTEVEAAGKAVGLLGVGTG